MDPLSSTLDGAPHAKKKSFLLEMALAPASAEIELPNSTLKSKGTALLKAIEARENDECVRLIREGADLSIIDGGGLLLSFLPV